MENVYKTIYEIFKTKKVEELSKIYENNNNIFMYVNIMYNKLLGLNFTENQIKNIIDYLLFEELPYFATIDQSTIENSINKFVK